MKKLYIILISLLVVHVAYAQQWTNFKTTNKNHEIAKGAQGIKWTRGASEVSNQTKTSLRQIPDDVNGRLYRLCKTWGYLKYFNQAKCAIHWDTLLNTTVNQVLLATNNVDFNNALLAMLNKAGNNSFLPNPGLQPDTNINFNNAWIADPIFSQTVRTFLDTFSLYVYPDNSTCFLKNNDFSNADYSSWIDFRNDTISMPINYTNEANRLTTMFYYWNVINYFSPCKSIMDQSWDSTLYQFIPLIRQASTDIEFHKTFLQLATKINDSHGFTSSPVLIDAFWGGSYLPQIYFTRIGTNCVVAKAQDIEGVSAGDILTALNGIGIQQLEDSLSNYIPASTPAALYRDIYFRMMYGPLNSTVNLTLLDSTHNSYSVSLSRTKNYTDWNTWKLDKGNASSYFITRCGYGYADLGKLQSSEVNSMYEEFQNAPAIIFDLRNYPNGTLWDLAPLFFPTPIVSSKYFQPALTNVNQTYLPGWYYQYDDGLNIGNWTTPSPYSGIVYILVNQETQSQAEYTCQYLSYHPLAKVIGTQTAGADGNISYVLLPGGLRTYFTSLGWYYADGYQQQRHGVKIDSIVSPTRIGLRRGHDEILDAVFHCPNGIEDSSISKSKLFAYPNPVSDELVIECQGNKNIQGFEILNSTGQIVYKSTIIEKTFVQTSSFVPGIYIVKIENGTSFVFIKFIKN